MQRCRISVAAIMLAGLALPAMALADPAPLQAGAARVEITPPASEFPYQAKGEKPFVGVHDPVFVRAIVLADGPSRVALLTIDATAVPSPAALVASVAQALDTAPDHVLIAATHTHGVPLTFFHGGEPDAVVQAEIARIRAAAVSAVRIAADHLVPASATHARGVWAGHVNNGESAGLSYPPDPAGPADPALDVVRLADAAGKPIALIFTAPSHAEIMFRSVTRDGGYEVTGDLPGYVARLLEGEAGAAPVVLPFAPAEADQLPLFKSLQPAGAGLPLHDEGAAGWALLDAQGNRLARSVLGVLATMPALAPLAHGLAAAAGTLACPGERHHPDHATGRMVNEPGPEVAIPIAAIRAGDVVLAGIGGDLGTTIGQAIRAALPGGHGVIITQTAGAIGYILPDAAYIHPGHGLMGSPLAAGCAPSGLPAALTRLAQSQ